MNYRSTLDPFLLHNFIADGATGKKEKQISVADFCSGSGILSFLLAESFPHFTITGYELQKSLYGEAADALQGKEFLSPSFVQGDLREYKNLLNPQSFQLIVSNPPYRRVGSGRMCKNESDRIAHHEVALTLSQLLDAVRYALVPLGVFCLSYHPSRLDELLCELLLRKIKPERVQLVYPAAGREAVIALVRAVFLGKGELHVSEPLFLDKLSRHDYRPIKENTDEG